MHSFTTLAQLVALYAECKGVTSTKELAELTGRSDRAIRKAKAELRCRNHSSAGTIGPELQCRNRNHSSAGTGSMVPPLARAQAIPEVKSNITSSSPESPASGKQIADDLEVIADRLHAAGGRALNRTLGAFEAIADPLAWIDAGCDLEKDIIPTIREVSNRKPANSIGGWHYFTKAVLERRERRLGIMKAAKPAPRGQDADLVEADRKLKEAGIDPALCF